MHFEPNAVYHLYNRGNEKQTLFFNREIYLFFLKKVRSEWLFYCEVLAYCLMPNHFHFVIVVKARGCANVVLKDKETHLQNFSKAIGKTLSSYTVALNLERQWTGNLFQKKTKATLLDTRLAMGSYLVNCVHCVHSNPSNDRLVRAAQEWEFSSLRDYADLRNGTLCNKVFLYQLTGLSKAEFGECKMVGEGAVKFLF